MSETNSVQVVGNSLDQALLKASGALGISRDNMEFKVLKERGNIFSLLAGKKVEILAWPKSRNGGGARRQRPEHTRDNRGFRQGDTRDGGSSRERRDFNRDSRENRDREKSAAAGLDDDMQTEAFDKKDMTAQEIESLVLELQDFCQGICVAMFGEKVTVKAEVDGDRLLVDIDSDELAAQFNRNQKLAEAFEHILRKKPRHLRQELPFRIFVDVRGIRRQREEDLVQMARDLSHKVFENQRPIVLNYKSSYDRKIIHMTLDKNERVYTKSIGTGPNRKLMILPIRDNDSRDDIASKR